MKTGEISLEKIIEVVSEKIRSLDSLSKSDINDIADIYFEVNVDLNETLISVQLENLRLRKAIEIVTDKKVFSEIIEVFKKANRSITILTEIRDKGKLALKQNGKEGRAKEITSVTYNFGENQASTINSINSFLISRGFPYKIRTIAGPGKLYGRALGTYFLTKIKFNR